MNTRLVNSAAGVVLAALTQNRTAAGIALALESAGMLMSPETAAELANLRARLAEEQVSPLAWARLLDAKSLDNFLTVLGSATEYEPIDGALSRVEEIIRSFRVAVSPEAEVEQERTLHEHVMARDAEIERLKARVAELEAEPRVRPVDEDPIAFTVVGAIATEPHAFKAQYQGESDAKRRLPNCKVCGRPAIDPAHDEDVRPQVRKLRALLAGQRLEDPHNGPLSHSYRVGRDLPETDGAR